MPASGYFHNGTTWVPINDMTLTLQGLYEPRIWNDYENYTSFYIDFGAPVSPFSFGQFRESISVMGLRGMLPVTWAEQYNSNTAIVYCDISSETHGVIVIGSPKSRLTYTNQIRIPSFFSIFYPSGLPNFVDLDYIFDSMNFEFAVTGSENVILINTASHSSIINDATAFTFDVVGFDSVSISF